MKANEAPEKLYVDTEDRLSDSILYGFTERRKDDDVEYIRTDAFIEKARKWFIEHTNISQEVDIDEDGEPLADNYIKYAEARLDAANEMFENFKNYMEGE